MKPSRVSIDVLIDSLVRGAPRLAAWWSRYQRTEDYLPDHPYVVLGELAHVVVAERGSISNEINQLFENIEGLLDPDETGTTSLIVVGLLEGIQNASLDSGLPLQAWIPSMGAMTKRHWESVTDLWSGSISPQEFNATVKDPRG